MKLDRKLVHSLRVFSCSRRQCSVNRCKSHSTAGGMRIIGISTTMLYLRICLIAWSLGHNGVVCDISNLCLRELPCCAAQLLFCTCLLSPWFPSSLIHIIAVNSSHLWFLYIIMWLLQLPKNATLWSFYMNFRHWPPQLEPWEKIIPPFTYNTEQPFFEMLVPTADTVRYGYLMEKLLSVQRSVLFTGGTGVGKVSVR